MSIDVAKIAFPVLIRNEQELWRKVGGLWIPPNSVLSVNKASYETNFAEINEAIKSGAITILSTDEDEGVATEPGDTEDKDVTDMDSGNDVSDEQNTVIIKYAEKEINWSAARRIISEIEDEVLLLKLLDDADNYNIPEDGAVYKSLLEQFRKHG